MYTFWEMASRGVGGMGRIGRYIAVKDRYSASMYIHNVDTVSDLDSKEETGQIVHETNGMGGAIVIPQLYY